MCFGFFGVLVQLDAEHSLFQLAATLRLQAGFVRLPSQIEGEAAFAEHPGDAGARTADRDVSSLIGGFGGAELAQ